MFSRQEYGRLEGSPNSVRVTRFQLTKAQRAASAVSRLSHHIGRSTAGASQTCGAGTGGVRRPAGGCAAFVPIEGACRSSAKERQPRTLDTSQTELLLATGGATIKRNIATRPRSSR